MKIDVALALLTALLREGIALSNAINSARAAGRDDAARARLQAKIDALP